jgi:uncharacterized coiled-coil DUF342 family protein
MQARNESFAKARQARCRRKKIHETVQSLVMMQKIKTQKKRQGRSMSCTQDIKALTFKVERLKGVFWYS